MGRLIAILLLIDRGPLSDHYMVLSPYLEGRRDRYIELLGQTTVTGDFDPGVRFFAEAIRSEAGGAIEDLSTGQLSLRDCGPTSACRSEGHDH